MRRILSLCGAFCLPFAVSLLGYGVVRWFAWLWSHAAGEVASRRAVADVGTGFAVLFFVSGVLISHGWLALGSRNE
jgi:hypothetical protein